MDQAFASTHEVEGVLLKLLKKAAAHDPAAHPSAESIPIQDIKGFDSLSMLEVLTDFEEETGLHFDESVFMDSKVPNKYLPVREVAEKIFLAQAA